MGTSGPDGVAHLRRLAQDERADLVAFLDGLRPDDWSHPTLCDGWSVRDVLAHLVAWDALLVHRSRAGQLTSLVRWTAAMARSGFRADRLNHRAVAATDVDHGALLARFTAQVSGDARWLFDRIAPGAQLAEYVVHHLDVRLPLSASPAVPDDRLRAALDGIRQVPGVPARARLRRNRWVVDGLDWAAGAGPEVRGPGVEVLLALAGRHRPSIDAQLR